MKNKSDRKDESPELFYAKILLFGEYSVIFDSMALLIPFSHFKAGFSFINRIKYSDHDFALRSNYMLMEYCSWLEGINNRGDLEGYFNINDFKRDLDEGMFLESCIPQGYGLGSSGALCAAVYSRYALRRINNNFSIGPGDLVKLKRIFAAMESRFHGTSSGMDPLNCYLRRPVLLEPGDSIRIVGVPEYDSEKGAAIFIIDTGSSGKTEPMVKLFLEKSREDKFMDMINTIMIPAVNKCINSMIKSELPHFLPNLKTLSAFQLEYMKDMIPQDFLMVWESGLISDDFYLKLCGSGGGGYILGFTRDMENTAKILGGKMIEVLPIYKSIKKSG